jgi:hypothetical protein
MVIEGREAEINKTTFDDSETAILFSVEDGEWRAFYVFVETPSPAMQHRFGVARNSPTFLDPQIAPSILLGRGPAISTSFYPSQPLRVDEFSSPSRNFSAVLTKPAIRGKVLRMDLRVQVANGSWEEFTLFFFHAKPKEQPARREFGSIFFSRIEFIGRP